MSHPPDNQRVVITGVGLASPLGNTLAESSDRLKRSCSGVVQIEEWSKIPHLRNQVAGRVDGVSFRDYPRKRIRTMGRVALLATYATERAIEQAGLGEEELRSGRAGVCFGSTHGSSSALESYCRALFSEAGLHTVPGSQYLKFMSHTCAANLAEYFGVRGRVQPTCSACTSGSQAIGLAFEYIRSGLQDLMLCGGAEELHFTHASVFDLMFAASTRFNDRPNQTPRPFDRDRDGVVVAEGAGTLVLESYERAKARDAPILGEIVGYGSNCDGMHITNPSWRGMAECMRLGLRSAGVAPDAIDYVNAHGTATELGDIAESKATLEVVGDQVPVSTQKGHTGHTLGACGAVELIYSLIMMKEGFLAPTLNLEQTDDSCAPLNYVLGEVQEKRPAVVLSNNFAFGGINTSLVLRRI